MATADQLAELRQLTNEPDDSNGWTDDLLGPIIDSSDNVNVAASQVWYRKAGQFSTLVDVSESGSSRKLSDLMKNAQAMGALYATAGGSAPVTTGNATIIQRMRRGFS